MNARPRAAPGLPGDGLRVHARQNPVRLVWSGSLWRSAGFLATYLLSSWLVFSAALTAVVTAIALGVTIFALPLLVAAAAVVHACAVVERGSLGSVLSEPLHGDHRVAPAGLWARGLAAWRDVSTWRELAYMVGLWAPLFALDTIVLSVWLTFLAGITLPLWYWAPRGADVVGYVRDTQLHGVSLGYFPHGPNGPGAVGLYVDSLPRALLAAAIFAILFLLFNYVLIATARLHARVARAMLRSPADPLREARSVLAGPGPLGPLSSDSGC
jgi:hypothetical protein